MWTDKDLLAPVLPFIARADSPIWTSPGYRLVLQRVTMQLKEINSELLECHTLPADRFFD